MIEGQGELNRRSLFFIVLYFVLHNLLKVGVRLIYKPVFIAADLPL